jgi:hypothetical protein
MDMTQLRATVTALTRGEPTKVHHLACDAEFLMELPEAPAYFVSRIVIAGLDAKKLCGIKVKPNQCVGMTGQSSMRVT